MISKDDCLLVLTALKKNGVNVDAQMKKLVSTQVVDLELLDFIRKENALPLVDFFELLRTKYNQKQSKLYKNIMGDLTETNITDVVTTLNGYAQQVLLFSQRIPYKDIFYRFSRLPEVYQCLYLYSSRNDLTQCISLLRALKLDIQTLETLYRNSRN